MRFRTNTGERSPEMRDNTRSLDRRHWRRTGTRGPRPAFGYVLLFIESFGVLHAWLIKDSSLDTSRALDGLSE